MTPPNTEPHVYLRSIQADERTSLSVLARHVAPGSTLLDLGCGSGALGAHLSSTQACIVDGVTLSETEAAHARQHYRHIEVADLEQTDLIAIFGQERYDAIVCADVLEHLRRPEDVLTACRRLLKPDGILLLSVPNAGYCGLLAELLQGDFRYREEGLLDRTHLRFFTRQSLRRFMGEQQWHLTSLETIVRDVPDSEFNVAFDRLPPAAARYILAAPDAQVYQFIGVAQPTTTLAETASPTATNDPPAQALFTAQLYLGRTGRYSEEEKITCRGIIGLGRQTLVFPLPHTADAITQLRLDPADRPGFLHLYSVTLRHADGSPSWHWSASADTAFTLKSAPHDQIVWNMPLPSVSNAALLLLSGDDPWIKLPIEPQILTRCLQTPGACLEVDAGWPMSADYMALSSTVRSLEERLTHLEASIGRSRSEAVLASTTVRQLQQSLKQSQERMEPLRLEYERLQATHAQLVEHVQRIETSTVYRATRPIVRAKMKLDRLLSSPSNTTPAEPTHQASPTPATEPNTTLEIVEPVANASPVAASSVDIIVPVFKGLVDTQTCIDSVLASSNQTPFRLIVINDDSPEPELTEWLRHKAAADRRIILLENEENLGFVGTANRGMALASHTDVLLLNNDTEVANDWLDRLRAAAYSASNVGTATPFSNNATICSYPRFCASNELPPGQNTASLDALFARIHHRATLDIPTGVGFCLYIRRDCLTQVGLLDTEQFGKGYGEENDFCQRAIQAGWRNLHALDTFVRHTGGVSFGDSKSPREIEAMATLRRLHPQYESDVQAFVAADPARIYREAIDIERLRATPLPRVLSVVHTLGGGTLRHTQELAERFKHRLTSLLLMPLEDHHVRIQWVAPGESMQLVYHWPTQSEQLLTLLRDIKIVHIHFHHILGLDPELMSLPAHLGVPYDFTAHDYYTACPQIALVTSRNAYCGEHGTSQCNTCLEQRPAPTGESILDWRLRHRLFLAEATNVLAPSRDAARRLARYFPSACIRFAPHLDIEADCHLPEPNPPKISDQAHLRVLVIGAVGEIKGADILEATAIEAARRDAPIEFHLMGYAHRRLKTQPHASLSVHGAYQDDDLIRLLIRMKPDLVWFPAQWPETYSYTLSACLLAGVPVVAPCLGAFPERLSRRRWTWLMPWNTTPQAWLDFFLSLRSQNFQKGLEPAFAPSYPAAQEDALIREWSYEDDYLQRIESARQSSDNPPL